MFPRQPCSVALTVPAIFPKCSGGFTTALPESTEGLIQSQIPCSKLTEHQTCNAVSLREYMSYLEIEKSVRSLEYLTKTLHFVSGYSFSVSSTLKTVLHPSGAKHGIQAQNRQNRNGKGQKPCKNQSDQNQGKKHNGKKYF